MVKIDRQVRKDSQRKKTNYFFIFLYLLALVMLFLIFRPYLTYLILGGVIVILAYPLNMWFQNKVKNKSLAAAIMTAIILLVVLVPSFFIGSSLVKQSSNLIGNAARIDIEQASIELAKITGFNLDLKSLVIPLFSKFADLIANSVPTVLNAISNVLVSLFIMFFLIYYAFKEGDKIILGFLNSLPIDKKHKNQIVFETKKVIKGVLYGQLLVALIQGFLGGIGFWIFGVPNPVLWGFVMVLMAFIPFLGTPLVWVPAVIFEFSAGNVGMAIGLLLYSGILVTNIDNFIKPKIIGRETGMHPLLVVIGIFGGISFFGLIGMLIGPVIVALCVLIIKFFNKDVVFG